MMVSRWITDKLVPFLQVHNKSEVIKASYISLSMKYYKAYVVRLFDYSHGQKKKKKLVKRVLSVGH